MTKQNYGLYYLGTLKSRCQERNKHAKIVFWKIPVEKKKCDKSQKGMENGQAEMHIWPRGKEGGRKQSRTEFNLRKS